MDTPQPTNEIHTQIGDNASGIAVGKQITQNVTQHFYNQPAPPTDPALDFAVVEERYRAQVVGRSRRPAVCSCALGPLWR